MLKIIFWLTYFVVCSLLSIVDIKFVLMVSIIILSMLKESLNNLFCLEEFGDVMHKYGTAICKIQFLARLMRHYFSFTPTHASDYRGRYFALFSPSAQTL